MRAASSIVLISNSSKKLKTDARLGCDVQHGRFGQACIAATSAYKMGSIGIIEAIGCAIFDHIKGNFAEAFEAYGRYGP
jgi:hypothetical protein